MTAVPAKLMSAEDVRRSLAVRDLTDEAQGPHAMQILLREIVEALRGVWGCEVLTHRESPIVSLEENYDALHYPLRREPPVTPVTPATSTNGPSCAPRPP